MAKKNVLVFPCGSEVGLEIHRAVQHSTHFHLVGGSSVNDHGRFVYEDYVGNLPMVTDPGFFEALKKTIADRKIDLIYPAMDSVLPVLKKWEADLGCIVVGSGLEAAEVCLSKRTTYQNFEHRLPVPRIFNSLEEVHTYPVFIKPNIGYGSRNCLRAESMEEAAAFLSRRLQDMLICEYLPGEEFTIDCLSNHKGELLFAMGRPRLRVSNGISVSSCTIEQDSRWKAMAEIINESLRFSGAWFFQVKQREEGEYCLLEIAARPAGTSGLHRMKGVNFPLLSLFTALGFPVEIKPHRHALQVDRALRSRYWLNYQYECVYVDLDDTLICDGKVNADMVSAIYQFHNCNKKVVLISKHQNDIHQTLSRFRLSAIFDEVIHLKPGESKADSITQLPAIFIDDSFAERKAVALKWDIPCFGVDMLQELIIK